MDINKATNIFLINMKRERDILKARETRASLLTLRKHILDKQKRDNHQNEYNRVRGLLENSMLPGVSKRHLEKRVEKLKEFGVSNQFDNMF